MWSVSGNSAPGDRRHGMICTAGTSGQAHKNQRDAKCQGQGSNVLCLAFWTMEVLLSMQILWELWPSGPVRVNYSCQKVDSVRECRVQPLNYKQSWRLNCFSVFDEVQWINILLLHESTAPSWHGKQRDTPNTSPWDLRHNFRLGT